jgi:hypothetical protein
MENEKLIAPCGMNCGICHAYLRDKNVCFGCWGSNEGKPKYCQTCIIKNCGKLAETESKFCYECSTYPCARLKRLDKRYTTKYKMSMLENLEMIRDKGIDIFMKNEEKRWACTKCGGKICVHKGLCLSCKS